MATLWPPFFQDGGWFTDREQHKRFVHRLKHMTTVSCCLSTQPGWIWYDFLWDVPHADRFNVSEMPAWEQTSEFLWVRACWVLWHSWADHDFDDKGD
jgi:hypothetical protein